jgi:phospholipase A1
MHKIVPALKFLTARLLTTFAIALFANAAHSNEAATIEQSFMQCKQLANADQRHQCFDAIATPQVAAQTESIEAPQQSVTGAVIKNIVDKKDSELTYLERKWRLSSKREWHYSDLETHHQNFIMTSITSDENNIASSPTQPATDDRQLENKDLQFQISLKTQVMHDVPLLRDLPWVTSSRLWLAYTQKSYWQIYNTDESRPFRESNFAPEAILSLGLDDSLNRFWPRMVNLGAIHESNGRSNPISRSWNRVYLESAWQIRDAYTLTLRPWYRIPDGASDDNPDISKFLGYGDLTLRWDDFEKRKAITLLMRNNLRSDNKGYAKLSMYYEPFKRENLKLYMSLSSGYGESLVDYNHSQTVFGIGFAVGE